jgi:Pyruvate/2-oxoacid:ferredoxin oxidoreductase delta subunit
MEKQPLETHAASPKRNTWQPAGETLAHMPATSGNAVNGLGETSVRHPSPFFWHDPALHAWGEMQAYTLRIMFGSEDSGPVVEAFHVDPATGRIGQRGPRPIERAAERIEKDPSEWSRAVKDFALSHEADVVGIAAMDPMWVFEGYEIPQPWVIVVGVAHDYEQISKAPSPPGDNRGIAEVGRQYARAARASNELRNFILSQGHDAVAYEGPEGSALLMIPAAVAAGLGELGKHGSLIHRELGASFRLSAVVTDMPLEPDRPDVFGGDDFCLRCQVCSKACPPGAIADHKQLVRGVERWYVDFDKCIPYFAETRGCAICIAVCPWSRPGVAPKLAQKMARRRAQAKAPD